MLLLSTAVAALRLPAVELDVAVGQAAQATTHQLRRYWSRGPGRRAATLHTPAAHAEEAFWIWISPRTRRMGAGRAGRSKPPRSRHEAPLLHHPPRLASTMAALAVALADNLFTFTFSLRRRGFVRIRGGVVLRVTEGEPLLRTTGEEFLLSLIGPRAARGGAVLHQQIQIARAGHQSPRLERERAARREGCGGRSGQRGQQGQRRRRGVRRGQDGRRRWGGGGESPPRRRVRRAPTLPTTRAMLLRFMLQPDFQCNSYSLCRQHVLWQDTVIMT